MDIQIWRSCRHVSFKIQSLGESQGMLSDNCKLRVLLSRSLGIIELSIMVSVLTPGDWDWGTHAIVIEPVLGNELSV